jgi:hypothetical protein
MGTASPAYKLDVATAGQTIVQIKAGTTTDDSILGFGDSAANLMGRVNYSHNGDSMSFFTNGSEKVRIDSSGNVGIGTSSPYSLGSGFTTLTMNGTGGGGISMAKAGTQYGYVYADNNNLSIQTNTTIPVVFLTNNAERARIDSSGNVLVGTTTAISGSNQLQVVNSAGDSTQIRVRASGAASGRHWRYGADASNTIYIINQDSTGVYMGNGSTSWSGLSDERSKDIIEPITGAAEKVATLRAVIGKYKTDEEGTRRSFLIAQDVQAVLPEAVSVANQETGHLGLSYSDITPLLVAAIQEMKAIIDTQASTITQLQADVAALKGASA